MKMLQLDRWWDLVDEGIRFNRGQIEPYDILRPGMWACPYWDMTDAEWRATRQLRLRKLHDRR